MGIEPMAARPVPGILPLNYTGVPEIHYFIFSRDRRRTMSSHKYKHRDCCWKWAPCQPRPSPPPMTPFEKAISMNLEIKILRRPGSFDTEWRFRATEDGDPYSKDGHSEEITLPKKAKVAQAAEQSATNLINMWNSLSENENERTQAESL